MARISIVVHSGYGHTRALAEAVAKGMREVPGTEATIVPVGELPAPGADRSYSGRWKELGESDAIVFGCPTYMGSLSAEMKRFMEHSSGLWMAQAWKDKVAAGFTNSGSPSGDKLNTLVDLAVFAGQHSMIWVTQGVMPSLYRPEQEKGLNRLGAWLGAMSQSGQASPETEPPAEDRRTAELFGRRVAEATHRWKRGA